MVPVELSPWRDQLGRHFSIISYPRGYKEKYSLSLLYNSLRHEEYLRTLENRLELCTLGNETNLIVLDLLVEKLWSGDKISEPKKSITLQWLYITEVYHLSLHHLQHASIMIILFMAAWGLPSSLLYNLRLPNQLFLLRHRICWL